MTQNYFGRGLHPKTIEVMKREGYKVELKGKDAFFYKEATPDPEGEMRQDLDRPDPFETA